MNELDSSPLIAEQLSAFSDALEPGTQAEQETAYVLSALAYAIRKGKTAELEARLEPLIERWLDESLPDVDTFAALSTSVDDGQREDAISSLREAYQATVLD